MPRVSVVIPCYNQASYLADAIESALGQTLPDVEVIVVDDGSRDETGEVAGRFADVTYVRQENGGVARARNTGARLGRGSHLIFLDADDRLMPRAAAAGLELFDADPAVGLVRGRHHDLTSEGAIVALDLPPLPPEQDFASILSFAYNIVTPSEAMFRRAAFDAVGGFRSGFHGLEDLDLYLRVVRRFRPARTHDEPVSAYRRHDASMSRNSARMLKGARELFDSLRPTVRGTPELERAHAAGLRWITSHFSAQLVEEVRRAAREGRAYDAAAGALALLRYNPRELGENVGRKLRALVAARSGAGGDDPQPAGQPYVAP